MKKNPPLFFHDGQYIDHTQFKIAMEKIGANDCKVLYIHSSVSFGIPNPDLGRSQLLEKLLSIIYDLGVETICMPTFTFSFCNGLDFDIDKSKSKMGAINEYFRKSEGVSRTEDPLMSVAIFGSEKKLNNNLGYSSIGERSNFDALDKLKDVKFLFFGTRLEDCFTYMHFLEFQAKVPYRYEKAFSGNIIKNDIIKPATYNLFVRYNGVHPNVSHTIKYGDILSEIKAQRHQEIGDNQISCVSKDMAREVYLDLIDQDPNYFIKEPFLEGEFDTTFNEKNMIAL